MRFQILRQSWSHVYKLALGMMTLNKDWRWGASKEIRRITPGSATITGGDNDE